jgi:hypothetical protein
MLLRARSMLELTDENKLFARSTADVKEAFENIVSRVAKNPAIRFRGRKVHRSSVLNALLLYLASRPREDQDRILAVGTALLNRHLDSGALDLATAPEAPAESGRVIPSRDPDTGDRPARREPRRRRPSA